LVFSCSNRRDPRKEEGIFPMGWKKGNRKVYILKLKVIIERIIKCGKNEKNKYI